MTPTILIILGLMVIGVLSVIAYRLLKKVAALEKKKDEQAKANALTLETHKKYLHNSIRILSQGIVDDQLTLTEGAIRISVLLDNLSINEQEKQEFSAFFQLAEATSHIPILDAWKRLSPKEQFRFEKERIEAEEKYGDFVVDAAKRLQSKQF